MKVILFGATGMIGEGALIECLEDPQVESVLAIVRRPTGRHHDKLTELIHSDFTDYTDAEDWLSGYDTCLFCLGASAAGMSEEEYRHITVDFAVAAGETLVRLNPDMRMCFISGAGTNVRGRQMWARVKGQAEQALLAMPWKSAHMFRPAMIQPLKGVVSGVASYRIMYRSMGWSFPIWKAVFPKLITTSEILGKALIRVARDGHSQQVLENHEINAVLG